MYYFYLNIHVNADKLRNLSHLKEGHFKYCQEYTTCSNMDVTKVTI